MRCEKAGFVMMKYMDSPLKLGRFSTGRMFAHLRRCGRCREEFAVYDEMMGLIQPPADDAEVSDGFEGAVMANIISARKKAMDPGQIVTAVLCGLSALMGAALLLLLRAAPEQAAVMGDALAKLYGSAASALSVFVSEYRWVLAGVLAAGVIGFSRFRAAAGEAQRER
jgi:hypothetical protein